VGHTFKFLLIALQSHISLLERCCALPVRTGISNRTRRLIVSGDKEQVSNSSFKLQMSACGENPPSILLVDGGLILVTFQCARGFGRTWNFTILTKAPSPSSWCHTGT